MTIEAFISTYGYFSLWIGTFLEGETILVLGGLAAHQGYLRLSGVILSAFAGSMMGDQFFFYLGRRHSQYFLAKWPLWQTNIMRVQQRMARYESLMIVSFRFLYGLRTVTPFVYGMSSVSAGKFASLNAVGALVWAMVVGTGGYFFGQAVETLIGKIKQFEGILLMGILVVGALIWILRYWFRRRRVVAISSQADSSVRQPVLTELQEVDSARHWCVGGKVFRNKYGRLKSALSRLTRQR
jgi:membrane protein DedA with SNARE-associated domain